MHRATVLLRVSTVVAFLVGGGAVGAKAEITASVPAGVHWRASPKACPCGDLTGSGRDLAWFSGVWVPFSLFWL